MIKRRIQSKKKIQRYNSSKLPEIKEDLNLESKSVPDILRKINYLQNGGKKILGNPRKKIKLDLTWPYTFSYE